MLKNNTILSKLAQGGPRLVPKRKCYIIKYLNIFKNHYSFECKQIVKKYSILLDINPQRLMIHVKTPEELILPEKRKKGKAKEDKIIQHIEPNDEQIEEEEEGPNVFQNNKGKFKNIFV